MPFPHAVHRVHRLIVICRPPNVIVVSVSEEPVIPAFQPNELSGSRQLLVANLAASALCFFTRTHFGAKKENSKMCEFTR
jgi:hypothetical protein